MYEFSLQNYQVVNGNVWNKTKITFGDQSKEHKITLELDYGVKQAAFLNGILVLLLKSMTSSPTPLRNVVAFDVVRGVKLWELPEIPRQIFTRAHPYEKLSLGEAKICVELRGKKYPIDLEKGELSAAV